MENRGFKYKTIRFLQFMLGLLFLLDGFTMASVIFIL